MNQISLKFVGKDEDDGKLKDITRVIDPNFIDQ
jgi:hypothetical protein